MCQPYGKLSAQAQSLQPGRRHQGLKPVRGRDGAADSVRNTKARPRMGVAQNISALRKVRTPFSIKAARLTGYQSFRPPMERSLCGAAASPVRARPGRLPQGAPSAARRGMTQAVPPGDKRSEQASGIEAHQGRDATGGSMHRTKARTRRGDAQRGPTMKPGTPLQPASQPCLPTTPRAFWKRASCGEAACRAGPALSGFPRGRQAQRGGGWRKPSPWRQAKRAGIRD